MTGIVEQVCLAGAVIRPRCIAYLASTIRLVAILSKVERLSHVTSYDVVSIDSGVRSCSTKAD